MKRLLAILTLFVGLLALIGCAGEDYTPVYFPGGGETKKRGADESKHPPKDPDANEQVTIAKLRLTPTGELLEEPLPNGNILEISTGTFISESTEDIGPNFESEAYFQMRNEGETPIEIQIPAKIGPFYFSVEGRTRQRLEPGKNFRFQVRFRPTRETVEKAGAMEEPIEFGKKTFLLSGIALESKGDASLDRVDDSGETVSTDVETIELKPLAVPAGAVKKYFKCEKITCGEIEGITRCQPCTPPDIKDCSLKAIQTEEKPIDEVTAACEPLHPGSLPVMSLDLVAATQTPITPSKQIVTLKNRGVADMIVQKITIEEMLNSFSRGQFQFSERTLAVGETIESAISQTLPITLPQGNIERSLFITLVYLPTDLTGFDGKQATSGSAPVTDKVHLVIETDTGTKRILLIGRTLVQEIPELQVFFATANGLKGKGGNETFPFEEVTVEAHDIAHPVYLKLSDTAGGGLRVTGFEITGNDAPFFEMLDTEEKVKSRQPEAGKGKRCSIPTFDPTTGRLLSERFEDFNFIPLGSQGFDLKPGAHTLSALPLFGCLNFHRDPANPVKKRLFEANLIVKALRLDPQGRPERNSDHSPKQTELAIRLVAAIDPLKGKYVLRVSQTLFAILNPTAPTLSAIPSKKEIDLLLKEGKDAKGEQVVMLGALILDPFDEMEITDSKGRVVSEPGDGGTAVFRKLDTRPSSKNYEEEFLYDYATLLHDSGLFQEVGDIFYDYGTPERPLPDPLKVNSWRIFTGALSYPGPFAPGGASHISDCDMIDPCLAEDLAKFTERGAGSDGRGACAFFYVSGGRYHSPSFEPVIRGEPPDLCEIREEPQDILPMGNGKYSVEGSLTFEDVGLRFWGPNYILNPWGPLGFKPPMDEVFHISFTTEVLKPKKNTNDPDFLPDNNIDFSRQEHKLNLTETNLINPALCPTTTKNIRIGGRQYSNWHYLEGFITKDEAGEISAGCPETGNNFKGGTAFLKGRRIDPESHILSMATIAKFSNREDLSLAFKNVITFIEMNGWLCNPQGEEADFEGSLCFDPKPNERDIRAQVSYIREEK